MQAETELEIPLEDNKENIKSETKPPKVKTLSEEEPSFTTVSNEELSERSAASARILMYYSTSTQVFLT